MFRMFQNQNGLNDREFLSYIDTAREKLTLLKMGWGIPPHPLVVL